MKINKFKKMLHLELLNNLKNIIIKKNKFSTTIKKFKVQMKKKILVKRAF